MRPNFTSIIEALPRLVPFVGPETMERARGRAFRARLGANESSFGPSPQAIDVMRRAAQDNWKYSDPENYDLRSAIAAFHCISMENVTIGEGIDGLLGLTCMLFLSPGQAVVTTEGAYPTFNFHVQAHGGNLISVPMKNLREDLEGLRATAARFSAPLIYVSNPNSPVGSYWRAAEIESLIGNLPSGHLLVLDEAYCDTAPEATSPAIDVSCDQVIRYRTFSKAYGLAGARIGYALGHKDIIAAFDKVRNHYGINRIGQLGAQVALADQDYLASAVARIATARRRISEIAAGHGLSALPSAASFVAIDCGADGDFAKRVLSGLLDRDVFVRKPVVKSLEHLIRVSCADDDHLAVFADALGPAVADARRQL